MLTPQSPVIQRLATLASNMLIAEGMDLETDPATAISDGVLALMPALVHATSNLLPLMGYSFDELAELVTEAIL